MNRSTKIILYIAVGLLLLFFISLVGNSLWQSRENGFGNYELDKFVNLPNYLVFFATGITAYLLYITLNSQTKANQIAAFENRFFKFIDYHRDNVDKMKYINPDGNGQETFEGNSIFKVIHYDVRKLFREYFKHYPNKNPTDLEKKEAIDFVYQCIFYGAGSDGHRILDEIFQNKMTYFNYIPSFEEKKTEYQIEKKIRKYGGHVRRLGHYFRNAYQAIKYVDSCKFLTENEKYEYVKIFRAQLSVYEQLVFFYNSLSKLGESWEYEHLKKVPTKNKRKNIYKKLLVTKYDLIRNTLFNDANNTVFKIENKGDDIDIILCIKDLYPLINLEHDEECSVFGKLPFLQEDKGINNNICRFCFNEKYIGYINEDAKNKIKNYFNSKDIKNNIEIRKKLDEFSCEEDGCKSLPIILEIRKANPK